MGFESEKEHREQVTRLENALRSGEQRFSWNRVSPRRSFSSPAEGETLQFDKGVLEPEICNLSLAVLPEVSLAGVFPFDELASTREALCSFPGGFDVPLAFPFSPEGPVARVAEPFI